MRHTAKNLVTQKGAGVFWLKSDCKDAGIIASVKSCKSVYTRYQKRLVSLDGVSRGKVMLLVLNVL